MVLIAGLGACGGLGGGCGCTAAPLPPGGLPADQTVEGGAQIRVTPAGFTKLTSIVPAVLNDTLSDGFCIGETSALGIDFCSRDDGTCTPGCQVDIFIDSIDMSVPQDDTFRVAVQFDVDTDIHVDAGFVGSCTLDAMLNNGRVEVDVGFGIDPADGELTINLQDINTFDLTGFNVDGCGFVGDAINGFFSFVFDLLDSAIGDFVLDLLAPLIGDLIQGFLPDPLGIEGMIDVGEMIGGVSPGTNALLEFRGVPGGYVALRGGGLSLGLITGINSDEDVSTRTPDLDSEAAFCVPPRDAPDFSQPPASLPMSARGTFSLLPADEFMGMPDPAAELAIGMSETTLDLAGHHMYASGGLCLGIGTSLVEQLNLGTIGILVPSLAELGNEDGTDPLLLVTRPQKPLDFTIGEGTDASPSLTIHIEDMEIDFYAFLFERFVRGFTLGVTMDVGINLEFTTDAEGNPAVLPMLTGLETDMIVLTVANDEFLREDRDTLEQVLPTIFDLALPLIADGLDPIALPDFAGFTMTDLQTAKVTTSEDDFLALFASLGASQMMQQLGDEFPSVSDLAAEMRVKQPPKTSNARAELRHVRTPPPKALRGALVAGDAKGLPAVTIDVDQYDDLGRPLEWSWNIDGGLFRPFVQANPLVIQDRAFAIQGTYEIELISRVVDEYQTTNLERVRIPVTIDSVGPRLLRSEIYEQDGRVYFPAHDLVSMRVGLEWAFGRPGEARPWTDWQTSMSLGTDELAAIAANEQLTVWLRDPNGNESAHDVDLSTVVNFHGSAGESGCNCIAGSDAASAGGAAVLFGLCLLLLAGRRRLGHVMVRLRRHRTWIGTVAIWFGLSAVMSLQPGCNCGGDPGVDLSCEVDEDCVDLCPADTIPICFDGECVCAEDVPYGRIGQYSDVALSSGGAAWVSAYASSHGDLVVARWPDSGRIPDEEWEFVDGVPEGPVVLPQSEIRGGIFEAGPDVGLYTSIATQPDDTPIVSYFDKDTGSLKFAANNGGVWTSHVVEAGMTEGDPELGFAVVGQYSSITVRSDDGRPGIAYFAHVSEGGSNVRTEVRYAAAQTAAPASSADWNVWTVDSVAVAPPDPDNPDVFPIPPGTGLFITSARLSDESPVIVYYNRVDGNLMLSRFDTVAGTFMTPEILDGDDGSDVGWYPSVAVDSMDDLHISYVSATRDDLLYVNTIDATPAVVDDGFRLVGQTEDGLPKPEFHFVGDDSAINMTQAGPVICYQDATTHELLLSQKNGEGLWEFQVIAGDEEPFAGGYGFYTAADFDGEEIVMSNWVIDQPSNQVWVEIFRRNIAVD